MAANGAICLTFTTDPVILTTAVLCARLPDQAEMFLPGVRHRTLTHHLYFWGGLTLFLFLAPRLNLLPGVDPVVVKVLLGLFAGGLLHVAMDMFSKSGIPLYPGKVWGARVYTTGSYSEYLFLALILVFCGLGFVFANPSQIDMIRAHLGF